MESIANLRTAATRAIWGENDERNQEPISGQTGDVSKGEPYDAGNMEHQEAAKFRAPDETGTQPVETNTGDNNTTPKPKDQMANGGGQEDNKRINPREIESSTTKQDSTRVQNDVRSPSAPTAHHEKAAAKENVDDRTSASGTGLDVGDNPGRTEGPGPKPVEDVAREQGGDAGRSGSDKSSSPDPAAKKEGGDEGGRAGKRDSGTGELYVRSSGLKADGGDFDAAAPGAGREADRLLEEKGVHRESPNGPLVSNDHANGHANGNVSPKEKTSLKTKIKAKLHRNPTTGA